MQYRLLGPMKLLVGPGPYLARAWLRHWEAAWTISNITSGQQGQVQSVIDANLLLPLINILIKVSRWGYVTILSSLFIYPFHVAIHPFTSIHLLYRVSSELKRRQYGLLLI